MKSKLGFNSQVIHAGGQKDQWGSVVTPIYQTSTFSFRDVEHGAALFAGEEDGYIYSRFCNPTIADLENTIAEMENGYKAIGCASGMAAVSVVFTACLSAGAHVVAHNALYGATLTILGTIFKKFGVESTFVDTTVLDNVKNAIQPNTKLIFLETPANPTIGICDIQAICEVAKQHNITVCVDNTFCSPYLQKPLDLGADIVLHSMTKFINGHADIVGGIVVAKNKEEYDRLLPSMRNLGFNMDPHQAFLARRGLKTLGIRMERAQENAGKIAVFLENHPKVKSVLYPGLPSHPQYHLAQRQMSGPGAMISFELKGGFEAGKTMMNSVELAVLAVSLGGIETLIQHPASMTHSKLSKEAREKAGITDGLVRLSVGIEEMEDIIADLEQALGKS
ncbi:MAG: aminotransferase class I/II-fold pyridoxal phosphate-dependent enzyme [Bacteroidales bacterium]|nr:aminotransferase class I/II-fold pyridoxal phosphate-dependent enzyme [Bacteroidales bacterium]